MIADLVCKWCGVSFRAITLPSKPRLYCSKPCGNHSSKNKRHGHAAAKTREHATWLDMRNRCRNPDAHNYARYGGRGIKVCERWDIFENFLDDMGPKPGKGYSIERNDNNGNYEPSNCRWATQAEQNKNKSNIYTAEEDRKIREAVALGLNFNQMTASVDRSASGIATHAYRIGLKSGTPLIPKTESGSGK